MIKKRKEKYVVIYREIDGKHVECDILYGNQRLLDINIYDIYPHDPKNGDIVDVIGINGEKTKARYEDARQ